jgi:integrase/recombinase XerD
MKTSIIVQEYVHYKKALGLVFRMDTYRLDAFLRHVGDVELDSVQPDQVRTFLEGRWKQVSPVWFDKFNVLSGFFKYASSRGYVHRSPLPKILPKKPERIINPFLYTTEQVRCLLRVPDAVYPKNSHIEPHSMRTYLILLYGTGLRPGEALRLTRSDVDLDQALLIVRQTKCFKSRLVPFGPEVHRALTHYDSKRPVGQAMTPETLFFWTRHQRPLRPDCVDDLFEWLRAEAGVLRFDGSPYQPRLYDFRHTFAVTRLVTWYRNGKDVQRLLPHLATYLGHVHIDDTAYYLTITNELMKEASSCFERYALREAAHA